MEVYLPIAEMSVDISLLFGLGAIVGFLAGLLGITGGFLMTPILIFIGIPAPVAVASQSNQLIASSISGVIAYGRLGRVDYRLGIVLVAGGLAGSIFGVWLFSILKRIGQIDIVISVSYVVLLSIIGASMLYESIKTILRFRNTPDLQLSKEPKAWIKKLPYKYYFERAKLEISLVAVFSTGFVVSIFLAMMGIGSIIMVPAMIYMLRIPAHLVPGTSLFQAVFVASFVTLLHAVTNQTVDVVLALFLLLGGIIGTPLGSQMSNRFRSEYLRLFLALLLLGLSSKLVYDLFAQPKSLYSVITYGVDD
jgi:uncharacterized membrane protein YfcA